MSKKLMTLFRHKKSISIKEVESGAGDPGGVWSCCSTMQEWA